jgi:hypothetical protein
MVRGRLKDTSKKLTQQDYLHRPFYTITVDLIVALPLSAQGHDALMPVIDKLFKKDKSVDDVNDSGGLNISHVGLRGGDSKANCTKGRL